MVASVAWVLGSGTAAAFGCHPSYIDTCVPDVDSDVDCLGGKGNGPHYTDGTENFRVVGKDVYKLDADHDGYACEPPKRRK